MKEQSVYALGHALDSPEFEHRQGQKIFLQTSRTTRGSPSLLLNRYRGYFPVVKQSGYDVYHSTPSCVEVTKEGSYTSPIPDAFMAFTGTTLPFRAGCFGHTTWQSVPRYNQADLRTYSELRSGVRSYDTGYSGKSNRTDHLSRRLELTELSLWSASFRTTRCFSPGYMNRISLKTTTLWGASKYTNRANDKICRLLVKCTCSETGRSLAATRLQWYLATGLYYSVNK